MQKIREIVKQIGGSEELADQLIEAVQEHVESQRAAITEEYKGKIQKAKQVCLEEVAAEKARIARKVEVFIESKVASIERAAGKTRAVEESAAVAQLRQIQKVLGGGDGGNSAELEALSRKLARIAEQTATMKEERDVAVRKANQANMIAARTLRRLRTFEEAAAKPGAVVKEDEAAAAAAPAETAETTTATAEPEVTTETKPEEIQAVRTESEEPVTTQASQADLPAAEKPEASPAAVLSPDQIAAQMGDESQV